jgi:HD-GYP domain-containing protein (c-di-GMP phosphodiesterase class II)
MVHFDRAEFAAGLVRLVDLHDDKTATHLRATGVLAGRIAARMHLPADTASAAELAGLLHDIGKVGVARAVLCKPGDLTDDEWVEMRLHAQLGAAVVASVPMLAYLAPIVRAHHERMDGQGYPDRLRGEEIPLEARIVAVADAFHALTTDRPYRRAVMPKAALCILESAAATQFDIDVVAATLDLFGQPRVSRRMSA